MLLKLAQPLIEMTKINAPGNDRGEVPTQLSSSVRILMMTKYDKR